MIARIAITASAAAAALLATLSAAAPASASTNVSCDSAGCLINIRQLMHISGTAGGGGTYVPPPPPPCWWNPLGDTATGSKKIIAAYHGVNPGPSAAGQVGAAFTQAQDLLRNPVTGEWYQLQLSQGASPAGRAECRRFPTYDFAPKGRKPPALPIPGSTLALAAYNYLPIPSMKLKLSPATMGYVNLGTYVWQTTHIPSSQSITVHAGTQRATLTMTAGKLTLSTDGPGTVARDCTLTGSHYTPRQVAGSGAGQRPDCGVLWQSAASQATITATIYWHVTWHASDGTTGTFPRIPARAQAGPIAINDIQSINGG